MFYKLTRESNGWFISSMEIDPLSSFVAYPTRRLAMVAMQMMREQKEMIQEMQQFLGGD
jgi:hypothetical protein